VDVSGITAVIVIDNKALVFQAKSNEQASFLAKRLSLIVAFELRDKDWFD